MPQDGKERRGQAHDPNNGKEEGQAAEHGQGQANLPCSALLLLREAPSDNGDEDHVVDSENDLENREGRQGDPGFGGGNPFHWVRLQARLGWMVTAQG